MKSVVIVGARGHGRGTLEILRARVAAGLDVPDVLGFVDDDSSLGGSLVGGLPVLGTIAWLSGMGAAHDVILAIAGARAKQALAARLAAWDIEYVSAVHPSAILGAGVTIAPGAIVGAGVVVAYDTAVGAHTTINLNATVGHDCTIGTYATIAPGVNITGHVTVGEGAEIQTNATVVPGLTIGAFARVGPASLVLRDVEPDTFVFGNPARRMPRSAPGGASTTA